MILSQKLQTMYLSSFAICFFIMIIRVFVANCSKDLLHVDPKIHALSNLSPELIVIQEKINSPTWKSKVVNKLEKADFCIVMILILCKIQNHTFVKEL